MRFHRVVFRFHPGHATAHVRDAIDGETPEDCFLSPGPDARSLFESRDTHLVQRAFREPSDELIAQYVFDDAYLHAHPASLDDRHLSLVHATIAAKLFDDGVLVLDDAGIRASVMWITIRQHSTILDGSGGKSRRAPRT